MKKKIGNKPVAYTAPVYIVGTYDENGVPNAMNAAWGGICVSNPPCISVSIQKPRKTYDNILEKGCFTINIPDETQVEVADYFGLVTGKKVKKFENLGVTPKKSEMIDAPYIEEFKVNIECKVINSIEIGSHVIFIGEIVNILADEEILDEKLNIEVEKLKPITFDPMKKGYYSIAEKVGQGFSQGKALI